MVSDKEKLLMVMDNLEKDYREGKISKEKYRYFKTKYEERLHSLDVVKYTDNIGSMQKKSSPQSLNRKNSEKLSKKNKKIQQDLVQKYIINPKKGDRDLNKTKRKPLDSGTFKLIAVLVLVAGFTCGIGYGIFNFDFDDLSTVTAEAICEDTAFPEINELANKTNTTNINTSSSNSYSSDDSDSYDESSYNSGSSSSSTSDSGSDSSYTEGSSSSNKYYSSGSGSSSSSNKYSSSDDSSSSNGYDTSGSGYSQSSDE